MSTQQNEYLAARRDGMQTNEAADWVGIPHAEARLIEQAIARGEIQSPAANGAAQPQEAIMAEVEQDCVELEQPDFEGAVRIFRADIKPANEKSGEHAQEASTAYKKIKELGVNTRAAKFIFKLAGESEEKRDDVLRSVRGLLKAMNIGISNDLVAQAEGENGEGSIIPQAAAENIELATLN